jgi:hypothetical protein
MKFITPMSHKNMILERINKARTQYNREQGYTYQTSPKIKRLIVGVMEANEIKGLVSECFPDCPYRFGFDAVAHMLHIDQNQIEISCFPTQLDFEYDL